MTAFNVGTDASAVEVTWDKVKLKPEFVRTKGGLKMRLNIQAGTGPGEAWDRASALQLGLGCSL